MEAHDLLADRESDTDDLTALQSLFSDAVDATPDEQHAEVANQLGYALNDMADDVAGSADDIVGRLTDLDYVPYTVGLTAFCGHVIGTVGGDMWGLEQNLRTHAQTMFGLSRDLG